MIRSSAWLVGAVGVQRAHAQVAGFRKRDGVFHGLAFADFADENHVRCLAQGVLQRGFPGIGIDADFTLGDHAILVVVHVFDRIFDRDDVTMAVFVAVADHRGERRRFARAGTAHHDHQAALGHRHVFQNRRQPEVVHFRNRRGDRPQYDADPRLLHKGIDAEAPDARRVDGEVAFLGGFELLCLLVVHQRASQFLRVLRRQALIRHGRHLAVELERRRKAGGDEQVGRLLSQHGAQQFMYEFDGLISFHLLLLANIFGAACRLRLVS